VADEPRFRAERRAEATPVIEWVVIDRLAPAGSKVYCAVPVCDDGERRARGLAELLNLDAAGNVLEGTP